MEGMCEHSNACKEDIMKYSEVQVGIDRSGLHLSLKKLRFPNVPMYSVYGDCPLLRHEKG